MRSPWVALINITLFRRLGCVCSHFQEITHISERKQRYYTETEHRGKESDEESRRETRSGETKYVRMVGNARSHSARF